jgi:hypothetical protein
VSVKAAFECRNCDGNHVCVCFLSLEWMARSPPEFLDCSL